MDPHAGAEQAWLRVIEVITLCSLPMALKAAVQLNVMDILAQYAGPDGFLSPAQIAHHFPRPLTTPSAATFLHRVLRLLASHGLLSSSFHTSPDGTRSPTFGLNPCSRLLLQNDHGESLAPFALMILDPVMVHPFYTLLHPGVLDDTEPFTNAHGMPLFTYTQHDPAFRHLFHRAMTGHSTLVMKALLETYHGFDTITRLVDVGGGTGSCLSMIVAKHPHIKGINFDLQHVIDTAPKCPGLEHVVGDMFEEIPEADAIFMKWILHGWSDAHCLKILENCNKALSKGGKVIVVDSILPTQVEHELSAHVGYQMDLLMFAVRGGKERTKEELSYLAEASGFCKPKIICHLQGLSIVELYKKVL